MTAVTPILPTPPKKAAEKTAFCFSDPRSKPPPAPRILPFPYTVPVTVRVRTPGTTLHAPVAGFWE